MDILTRLKEELPPTQFRYVHDVLCAFKNGHISLGICDLFIRNALIHKIDLLQMYDRAVECDRPFTFACTRPPLHDPSPLPMWGSFDDFEMDNTLLFEEFSNTSDTMHGAAHPASAQEGQHHPVKSKSEKTAVR